MAWMEKKSKDLGFHGWDTLVIALVWLVYMGAYNRAFANKVSARFV